ncbi:MAG: DUF885 domain-containing protein, partial [Proteobacteria bacterium]|nr:DUF885 domain-containing protein [Pseudomonadota bacterium]
MRRVILSVVVLAVLGGALLVIPTVWGKPWSIDHYFTRVMIEFALDHPMLLSYARVLDPYGLDFYSRDLEDLSIEAERRQAAQVRRALEGLRAYDDDELDESQRLSKEVLEWFLVTLELGEPFQLHSYPVEQFRGWQSTLPDFMVNFHAIENSGDASEYLSRLRKFPTAFKQLTDAVRYRAERGMLPPRFVIRAVRKEIADFTAHPIQENPLYQKLGRELRALPDLDPLKRYSKMSDAASLIEHAVYGSYRYLDRTLEELEPLATDDDGVWKLPNGDAYYRWTLRFHTTTDLGPDEIHEIGLREVDRIRGEMSAILEELGLPTDDADPIATVQGFNREERFLFPDSDEGRAEILASYQAIIDETEAKLPALFGTLPQAKVTVERVPAFKEAGSAGAYYNPPPLD